jgi:peptide/nickel transport system permease protein
MLHFIARRLLVLLATMLAVSFVVFAALELNIEDVATHVLGQFATADQRHLWLTENGYFDPFLYRYLRWLAHFVTGDWGRSIHFKEEVTTLIPYYLENTAILAGIALAVMTPVALLLGVLAGMREGSGLDRVISFFAIATTSIPQFASAVFLSGIFVFWLHLLPGASPMTSGFAWRELVMPVAVLVLAGTGYLARMTRASMVEVMSSAYVRTARMKGASFTRVVLRHALRNAMVTPVTVVMLYIPWLLANVVVVEVFFAYRGFGTLLYTASLQHDVFLIEGCTMVAVVVVVSTQLLSDLAYVWLNPRVTFDTPSEKTVGAAA